MSSSMDDNIELLEINSPSSTKFKSKPKRVNNKVGSPPNVSPAHSVPKNDPSHLFFGKANINPQLPPPKPPRQRGRKLSRTTTDITSESQETWDGSKDKRSDDLTESTFSSKSDNRSYREKFKERFDSVKKQAGRSVSKAHRNHTFKSKSEKIKSLKRSINLMKKENEEIETELKAYEQNKILSNDVEVSHVCAADAYNFFCNENGIVLNEENGQHENIEESNNLNKSTDVLIGVSENDTDFCTAVHFCPAENLNFNRNVSENELLWRPSTKPLEIKKKLRIDEPRFLAQEGFFVEEKPHLPSSHLNILEHRLLSINDKKWFNCEGELEILRSSYSKISYRPHEYFKHNPHLETEYITATIDQTGEENVIAPYTNILDILIMTVKFKHHPLFSPEHVCEQKLIKLFDIYQQKCNANKLERISKRLEAIRNAKGNAEMAASTDDKDIDLKKLCNYSNEIKKLRELYFEESRQNRVIIKSILQTWKSIKKIRQSSNYSNTAIKLNIVKEKCNYDKEKEDWEKQIDATCAEITSELDWEFQEKMMLYKKELEQWKLQMQDEEQIVEEIPKKPKKPSKSIDPEVIAQEVAEKFNESFKPPGEPKLNFTLSFDNEITDKIENSKEKLRRNVVATTKIYLRVVCNKMEVCKSKIVPLTDKFTCSIDEFFSIQVATVPESILIEVHEQPNTLMKRKLGEVKINLPSKNVTIGRSKVWEQHFEKDEIVHYKHEGVGSGVELKNISVTDNMEEVLYTAGALTCKIGWDIHHLTANSFDDQNIESGIAQTVLNEEGTIDINKLIEWANENNPDPQDPKYSVLYEYIKNYGDGIEEIPNSTKSYFRRNPDLVPLEFCEAKELDENPRFQILELRNRNEPEFVGMVVPNRHRELPLYALTDYKRRVSEESKHSLLEDDDDYDEDEIDSRRSYGRKYVKQVYTKVFQHCRNMQNNLVYEDVVNEKNIPHIESVARNLISNMLSWLQIQPAINLLAAKPTKKTIKTENLNSLVQIAVNIKSALNIPLRNVGRSSETPESHRNTSNIDEGTVRPFVVATYQNFSLQTSSMESANPVWNEELILPLESANTDYLSPNSLSGSIVLRLFDEIVVKARTEDVKAKNWLGTIEIPVSAISYNNKMEGLFRIRKPSTLLGYEQELDVHSSTKINNVPQAESQQTYLSLKIALQPNVPKLTQSMDELETTELPYFKQYILNWNETYNNEYPNRKFSALAIDINGKTTCVTRYIRALEPPQLNADRFDVSADQCARYVAMIPFTDSNKFYQNVWLSTEQLLKLMIGSVIDHAIALTCYLTSLDLEVWLLLGYGLPHGTTAYVLLREYARDTQIPIHFIYDIVTATKYDIMDTLCPLQKIFSVINEQNVFANVQRTDQIQLTRFDFTRRGDWLPLFNQQVSAPTNSVQHKLNYSATPDVQQLILRIDKKIRKKMNKLRKYERTVWNHNVSRIFKNAIARSETGHMYGRRNSEAFPDIRNLASAYVLNGYIVNLPYTSISAIIAAVMSTGVHLHEGVNTEFGLSVQVYPYPNHVLVVWICLAAVTPR